MTWWRTYLKKSVELANLKEGDTVLDFGCGKQLLKSCLPKGIFYTGYDIIKEFTDISDYTNTSSDIVIANHSLEHLTEKELREFCEWLNTTNFRRLVVGLPLGTAFAKAIRVLRGNFLLTEIQHQLEWREVCHILSDYFTLKPEFIRHTYFVTILIVWERKRERRRGG